MKRTIIISILCILASGFCSAQEYVMKTRAQIIKELPKAAAWYRSGNTGKMQDADRIISTVAEHQIKDTTSMYYGSMSWWYKNNKLGLNMAGFIAHSIFTELWDLQDKMSEQARKDFLQIARLIITSEDRRFDEEVFPIDRDDLDYSNAYCLSMQTVWLGAHRFQDKYLMEQARNMWHRYYQQYKFFGNGEFASVHYEEVDFTSILDMWRYCDDPKLKAQMKEILDDIYISQIAYNHPVLKLAIVGASRDYRELQKSGDARGKLLNMDLGDYEIPERAIQLRDRRKYPFELEGKGGSETPFTFKSYQLADAGMGSLSGWGSYFYQNLHLVATAGEDQDNRATIFCPGSYTSINGFTDQKEMTSLMVFNRKPILLHLTNRKYKPEAYRKDIKPLGIGASNGFDEISNKEGSIVLRAYGYDFHIYPFSVTDGAAKPIKLEFVERTETGAGISQSRKASFGEYIFPEEPMWVGALVKVVKKGTKVKNPVISFSENGNITSFGCKAEGLSLDICETDGGASVAIPKKDINMMPVLWINQ